MKVLYLGCFCEPTTMPLINKRTKGRISVSATTFQRALLHGYDKLEYKPNYIVNVPDIGSFPMRCSSPFFPRSKFEFASMKGVNGAFFNFTYIKKYSIYRSIIKESTEWLDLHSKEKVTILVYSVIYPYLKAAIDLKYKYPNVEVCCIVLDLPEYFGDNTSWFCRILGKKITNQIYALVPEIDSFVLLTEHMKDKLNVGFRPWHLLEGVYNPIEVTSQKKSLNSATLL